MGEVKSGVKVILILAIISLVILLIVGALSIWAEHAPASSNSNDGNYKDWVSITAVIILLIGVITFNLVWYKFVQKKQK